MAQAVLTHKQKAEKQKEEQKRLDLQEAGLSDVSSNSEEIDTVFSSPKFDSITKDGRLIYPSKLRLFFEDNKEEMCYVLIRPKRLKITSFTTAELKENMTDEELQNVELKEKSVKEEFTGREIILPIRPVTDSLSGSWSEVEGTDFGSVGQFLKWKMKKIGLGVLSTIAPEPVVMAAKTGHWGGVGMDNPHAKLMYGGHNRRSFTVAWDFLKPENKNDEKVLNMIIEFFRMCSIGSYGELLIGPPPVFDIEFVSMPHYHKFLVYKNCGIENCTVNFGGSGDTFQAMESGQPFMNLSLTFNEQLHVTRKDLALNSKRGSIVITK